MAGFAVNFLVQLIKHFNSPPEFETFGIGARLLMVCWVWVGMWLAIAGPNALIFFMTLKGVSNLETVQEAPGDEDSLSDKH